ncbi:matrixin family metalloprotease [Chengkuizengella sediminis]|uniref:matrixin family metalloprotease n=1 Tax=Chengkuizengella sediminis TaxID=1885917 RepID=UPI00138A4661|nr:matrixin family metalloprotease [Chengkuizengella sediminis]NDI34942.1 cell surface protein [Chengkuizengella sediminis]
MVSFKSMIRTIGIIVIALVLSLSFNTSSQAALLGWDLVDNNKHLDWNSDSKYISSINDAMNLWEKYKSGIIRPDTASEREDVFLTDYMQVSSTIASTSSNGIIKFNDYHYDGMSNGERLKTTTHEFGHALGLAHTFGKRDIMRQGKVSITKLSSTDKSSYDAAYATY